MNVLQFFSYLCIAIIMVVPSSCRQSDKGRFQSHVADLGRWFNRVLNAAQSSPMANASVPGAFPADFAAMTIAEFFDDLHGFPWQESIKVAVAEMTVEIVIGLIMVCCAVPVLLTGLLSILVLVQAALEVIIDVVCIFLKAASQAGSKAVRDHYRITDTRVITSLTDTRVARPFSPAHALTTYQRDYQAGSDHAVTITVLLARGAKGRIVARTSFEVTIAAALLLKNMMASIEPKAFAMRALVPRYHQTLWLSLCAWAML